MSDYFYKVYITEQGFPQDPFMPTVDIFVVERDFPGAPSRILGADGVLRPLEGDVAPSEPTLRLPAGALEALMAAVDRMKGAPSHARTESAVLREWLAVERARVDEALKR